MLEKVSHTTLAQHIVTDQRYVTKSCSPASHLGKHYNRQKPKKDDQKLPHFETCTVKIKLI